MTAENSTPDAATLIALLHGPDQTGIVARVAGWIFENGGNIIHADQHRDQEEGIFFQRLEWSAPAGRLAAEPGAFRDFATKLGMQATVESASHRPRVAVLVSKFDHCFHDLALRWKAGEYRCDIVGVISNHEDLRSVADYYGLPFWTIPVAAANKAEAEAEQLRLLADLGAELVVLARYMQVLSADFLEQFGRPVINIHHSFLPAFAGGRPYHQAYARGVKLIGATAHYVTAVLDDGPIINQDVIRVSHRHSVNDLIRKGRHLEKNVLGQAVAWHLERRILVYGNKTVIFD
jgi:formyltetrahydrofolate deformylase